MPGSTEKSTRCGAPLTPLLAEAQIAGVLKFVIDAHGAITLANRSAAAKRIYAALRVLRRAEHDERCLIVQTCDGMIEETPISTRR